MLYSEPVHNPVNHLLQRLSFHRRIGFFDDGRQSAAWF